EERRERARILADEHREPVLRLLEGGAQLRYLGARLLETEPRLLEIELGGEPRLEAPANDLVGFRLRGEIGFGDREPRLERAHFRIVERDLRDERHEHVAQ